MAARGPGRPAQLDRERIVAAALQGNLDTLTVRQLAARLGVSHGALYRWVSNQDELLDLVGAVMVDRVLPADQPRPRSWRAWLRRLAWSVHDEFLAVPGFATRTARPHRHNQTAYARLHDAVVAAFRAGGATAELAEHSCFIFTTAVVSWLAAAEMAADAGADPPRFDLFLDVLLRGLPAREPAAD